MPNVVNYVTQFQQMLMQKYAQDQRTAALTTQNVTFLDTKTIKIPFISVGGYKDHGRGGGFNRQGVENDVMTKTLAFDRDIEFFVDAMDVDETNQALAAANVTRVFLEEQAIPESDAFRLSKLYAEYTQLGLVADTTALTVDNILSIFDQKMMVMDEAEVPEEGRVLFLDPPTNLLLKEAVGVSRNLSVGNTADTTIRRAITQLENVSIQVVPSARMKTLYDFTDGWKPGVGAKQMHFILVQPKSLIAVDKHSYIRLWPDGSHTAGDGWLYQNRKYGDLFVIDTRKEGVAIVVDA